VNSVYLPVQFFVLPEKIYESFYKLDDPVKTELAQVMDDFGHGIVKALVTEIDPDAKVKEAMNEISGAPSSRDCASR